MSGGSRFLMQGVARVESRLIGRGGAVMGTVTGWVATEYRTMLGAMAAPWRSPEKLSF